MLGTYSVESAVLAHMPDRLEREIVGSLKAELGSAQIRLEQQQQQINSLQSENQIMRDQISFLEELSKRQGEEMQELQTQAQSAQTGSENEVFMVREELLSAQEQIERVQRENELYKQELAIEEQKTTRLRAEMLQTTRPQTAQIQDLSKENYRLKAENDVLAASSRSLWPENAAGAETTESGYELRKRLRERINRLESGATLLNLDGE